MSRLIIVTGLGLLILLAASSVRWVPAGQHWLISGRGGRRRSTGPGPTWVWPLLESVEAVPTDPQECYAVAHGRTLDGVSVRVELRLRLTVTDPGVAPSAPILTTVDACERALIEQLLRTSVATLPAIGEPWPMEPLATDADLHGVRLDQATVLSIEALIDPGLRRLIPAAGRPPWT